MTLFFSDYPAAIAYYRRVLGPPAYIEGEGTYGWQIGNTWLTLLKGQAGSPRNVEVTVVMTSPQEADRLHAAFVEASGEGEAPSNQLLYDMKKPLNTACSRCAPLSADKHGRY